jgi:uncharacterized membrane protein YesL
MAKLFGLFDNKIPVKGMTKDEAEIKGMKGFFTLLKTKLWKLVQLNLLYVPFCIPLFLLFYLGSQVIVEGGLTPFPRSSTELPFYAAWNSINVSSLKILSNTQLITDLFSRMALFIFLIATPILAVGPLQAGLSYVLQAFIQSKPVFVVAEYFGRAKSNFKQALAVSFIDLLVVIIVAVDLKLYLSSFAAGKGGIFVTLAMIVLFIVLLIYVVMHMYIYPLMVTFKMTMKQLYKNSFFLAMISFFPALGILIINFSIIYLTFIIITNPFYHILLTMLIMPTFLAFMNNYFIYPHIKKHLLDPALKEQEELEGKGVYQESIFKDR